MVIVRTETSSEGEMREPPSPSPKADGGIFDLGDSGGSNIAVDKNSMIAEAFDSVRNNDRP
ncbi:MAG: hypothetical protein ABSF53_20235 [Terracidiphilus sp.]|jgi:hypothetical protein